MLQNCINFKFIVNWTHYLTQQYRYRPKFYNWLMVFLKKRASCIKMPVNIKILLKVANICLVASLVRFQSERGISHHLTLMENWHFNWHISLPNLSIFPFSLCVALGLLLMLLWAKSKLRGSVSLPSLMGNYQKSDSYICNIIFGEWLRD